MAKFKGPDGTTSVFVAGQQFDVGADGCLEVPEDQLTADVVGGLRTVEFAPFVEPAPADGKKAKADGKKVKSEPAPAEPEASADLPGDSLANPDQPAA